jgi:Protein of unknown function (DUF4238)
MRRDKLDAMATGARSEPRLHHYVPRFLLRHFANDRNQLRTLDLENERVYVQSVGNAAAKRDYNTIYDDDGQREQIVEHILSQMEGHLATVVGMLIDGRLTAPVKAPTEIRQLITSFVLVQWARTPAGRHALSSATDAKLKRQIREAGPQRLREMFDAERETPLTDEEAAQYWSILSDENAYRFTDYTNNVVRAGFENLPARQQQLSEWTIFLVEWSRKTLLIGDQPVLTVPRGEMERIEDIGRVDPLDAEMVLVPISRRKALMIVPSDGIKYIYACRGNADLANCINELGIAAADRHVFSHPDDDLFGTAENRVRLRERLILSLERMRHSAGEAP